MTDNYRIALDKRIKAGKCYLNNKQTKISGYSEVGQDSIVIVDGKEIMLSEEDNLIMDGIENEL